LKKKKIDPALFNVNLNNYSVTYSSSSPTSVAALLKNTTVGKKKTPYEKFGVREITAAINNFAISCTKHDKYVTTLYSFLSTPLSVYMYHVKHLLQAILDLSDILIYHNPHTVIQMLSSCLLLHNLMLWDIRAKIGTLSISFLEIPSI
jgi:hypothetical protein